MLQKFKIRFYDNGYHQKGIYETITALDHKQATLFANIIKHELEYESGNSWARVIEYEFIN